MQTTLATVIVLAAGRSERFRAASGGQDKLHAPLGWGSVREHTLAAVQASGQNDNSRQRLGDQDGKTHLNGVKTVQWSAF